MTIEQKANALAGAIRKLIEVLIARDQGLIGAHADATQAQAALADALIGALENPTETRP